MYLIVNFLKKYLPRFLGSLAFPHRSFNFCFLFKSFHKLSLSFISRLNVMFLFLKTLKTFPSWLREVVHKFETVHSILFHGSSRLLSSKNLCIFFYFFTFSYLNITMYLILKLPLKISTTCPTFFDTVVRCLAI